MNQAYIHPEAYAVESKTRVSMCQDFLDSSHLNEVLMGCDGIISPLFYYDSLNAPLEKISHSLRSGPFRDGLPPTLLREQKHQIFNRPIYRVRPRCLLYVYGVPLYYPYEG